MRVYGNECALLAHVSYSVIKRTGINTQRTLCRIVSSDKVATDTRSVKTSLGTFSHFWSTMSQLFLASLLPLLLLLPISATATDEVLLSKLQNLEKCCNATNSLMLTFVNTINDLTKRLDRLTSCEENCNIKGTYFHSFSHMVMSALF